MMNSTITEEDATAESRLWRWRNAILIACCEAEMVTLLFGKYLNF
jgi:hypothetical protein